MSKAIGLICLAVGIANMAFAAELPVSINIQEQWACVFGGKEAVFHAGILTTESFAGRLEWRFFEGNLTIARGERGVNTRPGIMETVEIRLPIPEVKPGVVVEASLSVSVIREGALESSAGAANPIWVFPENPFYDRKQWLERVNINLFDPVKKTSAIFTSAGIMCKTVENVDALAAITNGVVIIGEGVSFKDYRVLPEMMMKMAAAGVSVLCLAPNGGEIAIAGAEGASEPDILTFRRGDIIKFLDKRLDTKAWPPDGKSVASGLKLMGERGAVAADIMKGAEGWLWLEMCFWGKNGKLVVCGFAIMEKWQSGPTPRFLFAKILEYMADR